MDERGIKVIGEAGSGEEALQFCRQHEPDVVLMDMNMPGMGGMTATKRILHYCPDIKILALSVSCEEPVPTKVMQLGAAGFISKNSPPREMVSAIRKVYSGVRHISDEVAQKMALSKVNNHSQNIESQQSIQNNALQNTFKIIFKPNKQWFFITNLEYLIPNKNFSKDYVLFCDAYLKYRPIKRKYEFRLDGQNLFNMKYFFQTNTSDYSINTFKSNLISRYFLASVIYNF